MTCTVFLLFLLTGLVKVQVNTRVAHHGALMLGSCRAVRNLTGGTDSVKGDGQTVHPITFRVVPSLFQMLSMNSLPREDVK